MGSRFRSHAQLPATLAGQNIPSHARSLGSVDTARTRPSTRHQPDKAVRLPVRAYLASRLPAAARTDLRQADVVHDVVHYQTRTLLDEPTRH